MKCPLGDRPAGGRAPVSQSRLNGYALIGWEINDAVVTTEGHSRQEESNQRGNNVTLTDNFDKLGGEQGEQGAIEAISQLFGAKGLQGIIATMQSNGMGRQVHSWIGSGQNLPVSAADIKKTVDPQRLAKAAQQQGVSPEQMCEQIAQVLPGLVDKATPNGQVPRQGGKDAMAGKHNKDAMAGKHNKK
jgi:uncharacterized protein YidB (DUF937 family)